MQPGTPSQTSLHAHPVMLWLMTDGRKAIDANDFLEGFASCLRRAGIDVTRITTGVPILHPQMFSFSGLWQLGKGASERRYRADDSQMTSLEHSPIKIAYEGGSARRRLTHGFRSARRCNSSVRLAITGRTALQQIRSV